jgi:ubiquitin-activating enzyme E1
LDFWCSRARLPFLFRASLTDAVLWQLLHNFPVDFVDSHGAKFWSGPKRPPAAVEFDPRDPLHFTFIVACAHIYASVFGVALPDGADTAEVVAPLLAAAESLVRPFEPKAVRIKVSDTDTVAEGGDDDAVAADALLARLRSETDLAGLTFEAVEFEKVCRWCADGVCACVVCQWCARCFPRRCVVAALLLLRYGC